MNRAMMLFPQCKISYNVISSMLHKIFKSNLLRHFLFGHTHIENKSHHFVLKIYNINARNFLKKLKESKKKKKKGNIISGM